MNFGELTVKKKQYFYFLKSAFNKSQLEIEKQLKCENSITGLTSKPSDIDPDPYRTLGAPGDTANPQMGTGLFLRLCPDLTFRIRVIIIMRLERQNPAAAFRL